MRNATLLLILVFILTACSRLELAYDHADWLAARKTASYLDLDRDQRQYIRQQFQDYREFHREKRIPQVLALTDHALGLVAEPSPSRASIEKLVSAAEQHVQLTIADLIPISADLLVQLSPSQIGHLEEERADRREEIKEESTAERLDKTFERIETWTSHLTEEQKDFIRSCDQRLPDTKEPWLEWRKQKDGHLLSLLRSGADQDKIQAYLADWWQEPYDRPEPLQQARAKARDVWLDCTHTFIEDHLTAQQREHALTQLRSYKDALKRIAAK